MIGLHNLVEGRDVFTFALFKYEWRVANTNRCCYINKTRLMRPVDRHVQLSYARAIR